MESDVLFSASHFEGDLPVQWWDGQEEERKISVGLCMSTFVAELSTLHNRKETVTLDGEMELYWQQKRKENPFLYNASKFRLKKIEIKQDHEQKHTVHLQCGITDYRTFVCTNSNEEIVPKLLQEGRIYHSDIHACMSDALGICAVVMTSDDFVLFVKRSHSVFEAQGMVDVPGGHPEPEVMFKKCGFNKGDISLINGEDVIYEIFHAMIREIRDEINLPESSLTWPSLLCILRNGAVGWKPHIAFFVRCSLKSSEVHNLYCIGGPEADESSELFLIHVKELLNSDLKEFKDGTAKMSACAMKTLEIFLDLYRPLFQNNGNY